jgi:hypothetical protein
MDVGEDRKNRKIGLPIERARQKRMRRCEQSKIQEEG